MPPPADLDAAIGQEVEAPLAQAGRRGREACAGGPVDCLPDLLALLPRHGPESSERAGRCQAGRLASFWCSTGAARDRPSASLLAPLGRMAP
jgi:hypothetical protein